MKSLTLYAQTPNTIVKITTTGQAIPGEEVADFAYKGHLGGPKLKRFASK